VIKSDSFKWNSIKGNSRTFFYVVLFGVMALLAMSPELTQTLAYDRQQVNNGGSYWMLLTCHFVHLGGNHALLNLAGVGILAALFSGEISGKYSAILVGVCALVTGLGVHLFSQQIERYYGFSGVLHGCLVGELIITIRRFFLLHSLVIAGTVGKVLWEWLGFGNLISSAEFIGGDVAVDAHLYGLISGFLAGVIILLLNSNNTSTIKSKEHS
jgi:rhomboid family GlyGly-CTERM serine protease